MGCSRVRFRAILQASGPRFDGRLGVQPRHFQCLAGIRLLASWVSTEGHCRPPVDIRHALTSVLLCISRRSLRCLLPEVVGRSGRRRVEAAQHAVPEGVSCVELGAHVVYVGMARPRACLRLIQQCLALLRCLQAKGRRPKMLHP